MKKSLILVALGVFALHSGFAKEQEKETAVREARLLSAAFTQVGEEAMPAAVSIKAQVTAKEPSFQQFSPFDMFGDDFFRRFFGQPFQQQQVVGGSGFLISPDGFIVTNSHVVDNVSEITVKLSDGREYPATVKGTDLRTELAVLKIEEKGLPYLSFGDSDSLKVGEWVIAIGNPVGLEGTLTTGVVSAKGRQDIGIASYEDFIQTSAPITFGNSGGPLLDLDGKVIGVNTAIVSKNGGYMGIGFAIPSKIAEHIVSQIIEGGGIQRGYLGIVMQPLDKDLAEVFSLEKQEGILISDVMKGSPADKAGLKVGDILLQANGKPVHTINALRNQIALMNPGDELQLQILRNHKEVACTAWLGSQSESELAAAEILQNLGLEVSNLTPDLGIRLGNADAEGVVITSVNPGSPAASVGLRSGAIITAVGTDGVSPKHIRNTTELDMALREVGDKKRLIMIVRYQNIQRYVIIPLR